MRLFREIEAKHGCKIELGVVAGEIRLEAHDNVPDQWAGVWLDDDQCLALESALKAIREAK